MSRLAGKRVLVVEDEPVVAMLLEDMLIDAGCSVVGPASRVADAMSLAEGEAVDLAVLDVNLNGETSFAIGQVLADRAIPFIFATGYGEHETPFGRVPMIAKPYQSADLLAALDRAIDAQAERQLAVVAKPLSDPADRPGDGMP